MKQTGRKQHREKDAQWHSNEALEDYQLEDTVSYEVKTERPKRADKENNNLAELGGWTTDMETVDKIKNNNNKQTHTRKQNKTKKISAPTIELCHRFWLLN